MTLTEIHEMEWRQNMPHYVSHPLGEFAKQLQQWMDDVNNQLGLLCGAVDTLRQDLINLATNVAEKTEEEKND